MTSSRFVTENVQEHLGRPRRMKAEALTDNWELSKGFRANLKRMPLVNDERNGASLRIV